MHRVHDKVSGWRSHWFMKNSEKSSLFQLEFYFRYIFEHPLHNFGSKFLWHLKKSYPLYFKAMRALISPHCSDYGYSC